MGKYTNGEIPEKGTGAFQIAPYYTEPSAIPIGIAKG